jgi:electron transfer flavoprotein alpha subunit
MKLLVLAEYAEGALTLETRATIAAAQLPGVEVYLLLAGEAVSEIAFQAAQACGITKVWLAQHPAYEHSLPASLATLIARVVSHEVIAYRHILCASTEASQRIMAHVSAILDVNEPQEITAPESLPIILARPTMQLLLLAPGRTQPSNALGNVTPVQWVPGACTTLIDYRIGERKNRTMRKTAESG